MSTARKEFAGIPPTAVGKGISAETRLPPPAALEVRVNTRGSVTSVKRFFGIS